MEADCFNINFGNYFPKKSFLRLFSLELRLFLFNHLDNYWLQGIAWKDLIMVLQKLITALFFKYQIILTLDKYVLCVRHYTHESNALSKLIFKTKNKHR